ncbi:MAG: hypothetical protein IJG47_00600 [Microbacterium sp.]|nr:hypothetical protein [Microbacterium sp.]
MSYDLEVYGKVALSTRDLVKVVSADRALKAQVDKRADAVGAVVWKKSGAHFFTIDGPMQVEPEDLPEGWAEGEGATVLYSLSITYDVSEGPEGFSATVDGADADAAKAFAERLAARIDGAVWDPQTWEPAEVVEESGVAEPEAVRERYLHMEWWRLRDGTNDLAEVFLRTTREFFPTAVPTRFGTNEPMQGKLSRDGDSAFDAMYREECEWGNGLMFDSAAKGSGHVGGWNNATPVGVTFVGLTFELSRLEKVGVLGEVERFLVSLAERTRAFFAYTAVNHRPYVSGERRFLPGGQWSGLPGDPRWMTWFDADYAELVRPHLDSVLTTDSRRGLLHRWSEVPMSEEELLQISPDPWIPVELSGTPDPDDWFRCTEGAVMMPSTLRYPAELPRRV